MRVKKRTARQDIYRQGIRVADPKTKSGFRKDRSQPADPTDALLIEKGQEYFAWKFRNSPEQISLTYPKRQELTRSEFQIAIYDFEDEIAAASASDFSDAPEIESWFDDIRTRMEELRDEQDDKKNNMPEQLQESATGELLQERYEALDEWITEIESIALDDYDDSMIPSDTYPEDHFREWIEEKLEEIQNTSFNL